MPLLNSSYRYLLHVPDRYQAPKLTQYRAGFGAERKLAKLHFYTFEDFISDYYQRTVFSVTTVDLLK